ncbi:hypothetical protein PanWU01x14_243330 [Parasponia andersonii]|uniref:Uncharacterized protein n=1 Tax=Parasponia andersonii TaxID=3476 RepID=A0A2P5BFK4_PARAD|nr:hypothetical protein PanWU01x14_243330 [Parasponia andersonii]
MDELVGKRATTNCPLPLGCCMTFDARCLAILGTWDRGWMVRESTGSCARCDLGSWTKCSAALA